MAMTARAALVAHARTVMNLITSDGDLPARPVGVTAPVHRAATEIALHAAPRPAAETWVECVVGLVDATHSATTAVRSAAIDLAGGIGNSDLPRLVEELGVIARLADPGFVETYFADIVREVLAD